MTLIIFWGALTIVAFICERLAILRFREHFRADRPEALTTSQLAKREAEITMILSLFSAFAWIALFLTVGFAFDYVLS